VLEVLLTLDVDLDVASLFVPYGLRDRVALGLIVRIAHKQLAALGWVGSSISLSVSGQQAATRGKAEMRRTNSPNSRFHRSLGPPA
jgi:hypothetical protein